MEQAITSGTERRTVIDPEVMANVEDIRRQSRLAHSLQYASLALFSIFSVVAYFYGF